MTKTFLNSQINGIQKLEKVKVGALFMEAGTGKTRTALELIKSTDADYIIWFTPCQTKVNLKSEIEKWGGLDCDILGIESIQNSDRIYLEYLSKLEGSKKAFIVIDESLKVKNVDAKRTKRVLEMAKHSEYRLILNGTPLSKNLLDLYSQMEFLSPKILKMSLAEFKNTFCEYIKITYHSHKGASTHSKEFIKQYHNLEYLYSLIEPFVFESKLSISVGKQYIDLDYELTQEEVNEHDRLKEKYLDDEVLMAMNNNIFLTITQKMQHSYSLSIAKFEIVDKLIKDLETSKVLIYAKYIDTQKALKSHYKDIEVKSLQKHSYGLNLQDYNIIIFWDKTWDYAQREQAEHRTYRTGQKDNCIYYDLTANTGLDSMMNQNIDKKGVLLNDFKKLSSKQLKQII